MRSWFANNHVDKFTMAVWFKRRGEDITSQSIVNYGDCGGTTGVLIGHANGSVVASITTENTDEQLPFEQVNIATTQPLKLRSLYFFPSMVISHQFGSRLR